MRRGRPSRGPGSPGYVPRGTRLGTRNVGASSARFGYEAPLPLPPPEPPPPIPLPPPRETWYSEDPSNPRQYYIGARPEPFQPLEPAQVQWAESYYQANPPPAFKWTEGKWDVQRGLADPRDYPVIGISEALAGGALLGGYVEPGLEWLTRQAASAGVPMAGDYPLGFAPAEVGVANIARSYATLLRAFPYVSAGWLYWELWKWVNRQRYRNKDAWFQPGTPGPGNPGYVPPGYSMLHDNTLYKSVWPGWAGSIHAPNAFYRQFWDGTWPNVVLPAPLWGDPGGAAYRMVDQISTPGVIHGVDYWQYDGVGPGTGGSLRPGRIILPGDADPVTEAMPELEPFTPPMEAPPGWRVLPRPGRVLDEDPYDEVPEHFFPEEVIPQEAGPKAQPRPRRRWPRRQTVIDEEGPHTEPDQHEYKAPKGYREVKVKTKVYWAMRRLAGKLGKVTEFMDAVEALHGSLPRSCQRSRHWVGPGGKFHRKKLSSMLRDLYNCAAFIDVDLAFRRLVVNELGDRIIARLNRATYLPGFMQMPGTTISHSQRLGEAYSPSWLAPFSDPLSRGYRSDRSIGGGAGLSAPDLRPSRSRFRIWAPRRRH